MPEPEPNTTRLYRYVGPDEIRHRACGPGEVATIQTVSDLEAWLRETGPTPDPEGLVAVTFVIDRHGLLRVADRRSEHVACAAGAAILSAGELFFGAGPNGLQVAEVSNQSTGYCPEPESWPAVAAALDRLPIAHPGRFTREVVFRRCPTCGQRNIVKEGWFVCAVCGGDLPTAWNFA
jgi:hypothetical protein